MVLNTYKQNILKAYPMDIAGTVILYQADVQKIYIWEQYLSQENRRTRDVPWTYLCRLGYFD